MPGHLNIRNPIHLNIWQLHLYKYTNWYFILPPGPRGLARPRHIYMSLPYTSRIYIKQQNTWLEVLTILKHMKVNGKDYTINYGKENSCLKPPTRHDNYMLFIYIYTHCIPVYSKQNKVHQRSPGYNVGSEHLLPHRVDHHSSIHIATLGI